MGWLLVTAVAFAVPGSSRFQQRAAAFGMGAIGTGAPSPGRLLEAVGTGIADHPLFESLYIGEPDRVVATTRWGKVTARDLYLYLVMARSEISPFILEKFDKEKLPSQRRELAKLVHDAIDDYVFVNIIVPRLTADLPWTDVEQARARMAALEAYRFVYVASVVRSKIRLSEADRVKYLQEHRAEIAAPERWRVRYIFMRSEESDPLDQQDAVQKRLEDLRQDILRGKIDFPEAARKYSEAPSAANGGEIPPFRRGEIFFYFEQAAANLKPGELSDVIRGPHGFYLLQLIEALPPEELSLDNPIQAGKVEDGLTRQVLRAQYLWDLKVLLEQRFRPVYNMRPWDEKRLDDVIGSVAGFSITKGQLLRMMPSLESEDLVSQESAVESTMRRLLEGEAIARAVVEAGGEASPFLPPMLEIARNMARLQQLKERLACQLQPNRAVVRRFWREHPELFTPLAMKRIVEVTLTPLNTAPLPEQSIAELERALAEGGGEAPSPLVPKDPSAVIPDLGDLTTTTQGTSSSSDVNAEMALPSADRVTSAVEETTEPLGSGAARGNETTATMPRGGAGPNQPAAGGLRRPARDAQPSPLPASGTWVGPLGFVEEVSTECSSPAKAPWPVARPPVRARRISPTRLREVVQNYRSSDWQLAYRDLGFLYLEDHPELPRALDTLEVGAYLPPKYENGRAITYCVEEARRPPKPTFEEIEPYAYRVWREVQVDKKLRALRQRELEKAQLQYTFEK